MPLPYFVSDGQLTNDLSDCLQKEEGTLAPFWANILSQEHAKAYQWLVMTLLGKGFLIAQVTAWDMGPYYERDLTLYFALRRGAALQAVDDRQLLTLDIRKEVQEITCLSIAGVFQDPQGTAGQVGVGPEDTSQDSFVWPPRDGSINEPGGGAGEITRW